MEADKEIIKLAKEIIDDAEGRRTSVESLVFKAYRLAKLVDNEGILIWLASERFGYSDKEPDLTNMKATGRTFDEQTRIGYWGPVSTQEAAIETALAEMEIVKGFKPSGEFAALQFSGQQQQVRNLSAQTSFYKNICSKVIAGIQDFAVNTYYAHKFKQEAISIIEKERREAESIMIKKFPDLKDFFEVINKNIDSNKTKDWTTVALQCRNILIYLSGELWKSGTKKYTCRDGESIKTDGEKNKLIAYLDTKISGSTTERAKAVRLFKTIHEIFAIGGKSKRSIGKNEFSTIVTQTFILLYDLSVSTDLVPITDK